MGCGAALIAGGAGMEALPRDTVSATVMIVTTGRTSMMQGAVHLVLFATYLFLACVP